MGGCNCRYGNSSPQVHERGRPVSRSLTYRGYGGCKLDGWELPNEVIAHGSSKTDRNTI